MLRTLQPSSPIPKIPPGTGRIALTAQGPNVAFSELSSAYPLKLLSPRISQDKVAVVYVLTYGGGLVSGDQLNLGVDVSGGAALVLLSQHILALESRQTDPCNLCQGSTKVFKTRPGQRLASASTHPPNAAEVLDTKRPSTATSQVFNFNVASGSTLSLLMEPVTCFRSASYNQIQTFRLEDNLASLVVLDWITSGRKALGEEWAFSRYYSANEIWVEKKRVMRDVTLLEDETSKQAESGLPAQSLAERLAPYACYATVFFYGPKTQGTVAELAQNYESISIFRTQTPADLLWSLSPVGPKGVSGAVLRVAAMETEMVKNWLSKALTGLEEVIGKDVYSRAFG
ncbi:hypothetical protein AX17_000525 [Amanita inopinata Kibby_2008]|nr:hypothetical protein AX17_000525 [Amanita inopinata Kibby_2008]